MALKNTDIAKVLDKGQTFEVAYRTTLDKDAFVAALVDAGGSMADAAYTIQNTATLSIGGATLSGSSKADFKPSVPMSANKSSGSTPQNGLETQSASFTVKAGTGEASREDFTLTDQITTMYGPNDSAAAAQKAMMFVGAYRQGDARQWGGGVFRRREGCERRNCRRVACYGRRGRACAQRPGFFRR